jgi:hypothetical protein
VTLQRVMGYTDNELAGKTTFASQCQCCQSTLFALDANQRTSGSFPHNAINGIQGLGIHRCLCGWLGIESFPFPDGSSPPESRDSQPGSPEETPRPQPKRRGREIDQAKPGPDERAARDLPESLGH